MSRLIDAIGEQPLVWTDDDFALGRVAQWEYDVEAIKKLPSAQPETGERTAESAQNVPDGDLISRKAAIDALAKKMPSWTTPDGSGEFDHDIQITDEAFVDCMQIINELPPAEPEPERFKSCKNCIHLGHGYMMPCKNCRRNQMMPDWYEVEHEWMI